MIDPLLLAPDGSLALAFLVFAALGCLVIAAYLLLTKEDG